MHPNDSFSSPPGLGNAVAGLTWTSPVAGTATISGDLWLGSPQLGRDIDWSIQLNGTIITDGTLHHNDPFNSSSPYSFANGSGGVAALTFVVSVGDVVNLEIVRASTFGTFTGVDET